MPCLLKKWLLAGADTGVALLDLVAQLRIAAGWRYTVDGWKYTAAAEVRFPNTAEPKRLERFENVAAHSGTDAVAAAVAVADVAVAAQPVMRRSSAAAVVFVAAAAAAAAVVVVVVAGKGNPKLGIDYSGSGNFSPAVVGLMGYWLLETWILAVAAGCA
jgi:hypothetical protein